MTLLCSYVDTLCCSLWWINKRYESVTLSIVHNAMDGVGSRSKNNFAEAELGRWGNKHWACHRSLLGLHAHHAVIHHLAWISLSLSLTLFLYCCWCHSSCYSCYHCTNYHYVNIVTFISMQTMGRHSVISCLIYIYIYYWNMTFSGILSRSAAKN